MKIKNFSTLLSICFVLIVNIIQPIFAAELKSNGTEDYDEEVERGDFPDGFLFGAASSSYQVMILGNLLTFL